MQIVTERLFLRPVRDSDRVVNAQIFADPEVRRFALKTLDLSAADARLDRIMAERAERGFGMLAVEDRRTGSLIGMVGLTSFSAALRAATPSQPRLQIAWQLAKQSGARGSPRRARSPFWNTRGARFTKHTSLPSQLR